ncbi:uncharacterized protein Z518_06623 [Rhinocladiella mackenziei CBS 650.93]|uniref:Uncharacterized protein n=1 Tax=Rhinocladiella mackenziei CBS 650.93 TaxID=1442369 RepID=A0A0D2GY05_9EURO|nr:uncharacterized protein Z518_06623 [Rhinocladiella mackenziei CBS 650.93]KIX03073.1 hypothetical protein Z518_06623 [Rhinocladiella mackenziei CBS 650.93]
MKLTPSLLYVRSLLASIHPPSPPTPRESRKLLQALESKFQKHLDESHPSPKALGLDDPTDETESIPDPVHRVTRSTHSHLDGILRHPLFRSKSPIRDVSRHRTSNAVAAFDSALVAKKLNFDIVEFCTQKYLQGVRQKETVHKDGKLGPRLASWFTALNELEKRKFLAEDKALKAVVRVMYMDGLEAEVWEWLRMLYESHVHSSISEPFGDVDPDTLARRQAEDRLVGMMIKESIRKGAVQEAVQQFIQDAQYRQTTRRMNFHPFGPWHSIAFHILFRREDHQIPGHLFDLMLTFGLQIDSSPFDREMVRIYHPQTPTAIPFSIKLKDPSFLLHFMKWQNKLFGYAIKLSLVAILDAAQLSLEQGHPKEAWQFLYFAERNYPNILSTSADSDIAKRLQSAREKVSNQPENRVTDHIHIPALV